MQAFLRDAWRIASPALAPMSALAGMALISAGAAFIYLPAGLIAAGLLIILALIDSRS